jgi:hypothetical protein
MCFENWTPNDLGASTDSRQWPCKKCIDAVQRGKFRFRRKPPLGRTRADARSFRKEGATGSGAHH